MTNDNRSMELQNEYRQRFAGFDQYRNDVWQVLCNAFFSRLIMPADSVLDLGAGWGEFSRNIRAKKKFAMDLNPDCGARLDSSTVFLHQDCAERWPLEDGALDVVFSSNFLEHLPNKDLVEKTLKEAYRCLRPGGRIICLGPNIKFVPGAYWDFWDHYIPLSEASMAEVLALTGFSVVKKIDRFLPYTMSEGRKPPLLFVKIYVRLEIAWRFFGKQFLVIAEKKR